MGFAKALGNAEALYVADGPSAIGEKLETCGHLGTFCIQLPILRPFTSTQMSGFSPWF
jgi:hypothetical protein